MLINKGLMLFVGLLFSYSLFADCPDVKVYCYSYEVDTASPKAKTNLVFKAPSKWDWKNISCQLLDSKEELIQQCEALDKNVHSLVYPENRFKLIADYHWATVKKRTIPISNWMGSLKSVYPQFSKAAIKDIILPGTHDSATSGIEINSEFSPDGSAITKRLKILKSLPLYNQIFAYWSKTQPLTIKQQLDQGIRYLDLRLCDKNGEVYSCHGKYSDNISTIIQQVKAFTDDPENKNEIILLDMNHFYNMSRGEHALVIHLLLSQLGDKIADSYAFNASTPLNQFWEKNKQIIVIYHNKEQAKHYPQLWPSSTISSRWPNKQKSSDLIQYLNSNLNNRLNDQLYVISGVLTPNEDVIVSSLYNPFAPNSIKTYTLDYKQDLYNWLFDKQNKLGQKGSIIIEDWTTGQSLTHYVIDSNIKKFTSVDKRS